MLHPGDVTGLILAGGQSRRFGSEKAWHLVDGKPMIAWVQEAVSAVADSVLISVGSAAEVVRFERYGPCVIDQYADCGPLAGIHAGWQQTSTDWLLVAGCDMPFLTPDALRRLLQAAHTTSDIIVAEDDAGRCHPLCACYHRRTAQLLQEHLDQKRLALFDLLNQLSVVQTVLLPSRSLRNINRPDDLR